MSSENDADFVTNPHVPKPFCEMRDRIHERTPRTDPVEGSSCGGALEGDTPTPAVDVSR